MLSYECGRLSQGSIGEIFRYYVIFISNLFFLICYLFFDKDLCEKGTCFAYAVGAKSDR